MAFFRSIRFFQTQHALVIQMSMRVAIIGITITVFDIYGTTLLENFGKRFIRSQ